MTRIEKSDAQLDAEAEARRRALEPPSVEHGMDDPDAEEAPQFRPSGPPHPAPDPTALRALIIDIRKAFHYEVPGRLHQQSTSAMSSDELDERGWPKDTDEGGVGPPYSSMMHRWLGTNSGPSDKHPWDTGPNPRVRPTMASIQNESERCHARHTSHSRPGFSRSVCAEMMYLVGAYGQEPEDLAWYFDLPLEKVESLLFGALRHARQWREDTEQKLSRIVGTEEPLPERRRVA